MRRDRSVPVSFFSESFRFGNQIFNNASEQVGSGSKVLGAIRSRVRQSGPVKTSSVQSTGEAGSSHQKYAASVIPDLLKMLHSDQQDRARYGTRR